MSGGTPAVSVVMPVYNAEKTLREAVSSVCAQTEQDWELLLVDDASTDGSASLAETLAGEDGRIRLLRNPRNLGVAETRNRGIAEARGEFVALLDSDDRWRPEKLRCQLALARESGADLLYCSYGLIDAEGKPCCADFLVPSVTDWEKMLVRSVISCSTAMIRRELLLQHPFQSIYAHEDYVLWLELLRDGCRAVGCPEVLADYRVSADSRSGNKLRSALGRWTVYRRYLHLPFFRSVSLLQRYAFAALHKYKRF